MVVVLDTYCFGLLVFFYLYVTLRILFLLYHSSNYQLVLQEILLLLEVASEPTTS